MFNPLEDLRSKLEADRMYKVEGSSYSHVRPADMSTKDLQELALKAQTRGQDSLVEGSIMYHNQILG